MATREASGRSLTGVRDGTSRRSPTWLTSLVALGASAFLIFGVWAFGWPHSFYESVATYPPFNLHLFHDVGAFQLGIGAAMIGGLVWRDALFVGLVGGVVGATIHAISHIVDADLGGRASDPYTLSGLALLILVAAVARARTMR